jgi:hypothetical protein
MSKNENELSTAVDNSMIANFKTREEYAILLESGAIPSGFDTPEKLMTVVQMGKELGLPALVSINNINIIKGRTVISSTMLGAMLKARNIEWVWTKDHFTEEDGKIVTEIEFEYLSKVSKRPKLAKFSISWGQMQLAGYTDKQNWEKYPKEMMRARCMAYGVRAYFPEVLMGMYTDLEMVDANEQNYATKLTEEGDIQIIQDAEEVND